MRNSRRLAKLGDQEEAFPGRQNPFLRVAGFLIVVASLVFFGLYVKRHWQLLAEIPWDLSTIWRYSWLIIGYQIQLLIGGLNWCILMTGSRDSTPRRILLGIFAVSQFGKYVPGNFSHMIGRVALSTNQGLSAALVAGRIALEILVLLLVGAAISALALVWTSGANLVGVSDLPRFWTLGLILVGILSVPILGRLLLNHATRLPWIRRLSKFVPEWPPKRIIVFSIGVTALNFVFLGVLISLLASSFDTPTVGDLLFMVGLSTLAWTAGFVTPGAPAGVGIREAILAAGLSSLYGPQAVLTITIGWRLITTVGDVVTFFIGLVLLKEGRRKDPALEETG